MNLGERAQVLAEIERTLDISSLVSYISSFPRLLSQKWAFWLDTVGAALGRYRGRGRVTGAAYRRLPVPTEVLPHLVGASNVHETINSPK
jgi:hypothetical protein